MSPLVAGHTSHVSSTHIETGLDPSKGPRVEVGQVASRRTFSLPALAPPFGRSCPHWRPLAGSCPHTAPCASSPGRGVSPPHFPLLNQWQRLSQSRGPCQGTRKREHYSGMSFIIISLKFVSEATIGQSTNLHHFHRISLLSSRFTGKLHHFEFAIH